MVTIGREVDPLYRGGIVKVVEDGVTLLGAPLGSEAFVGREPQRKVEKVREISEILPFNSCTIAPCRPIGDLIAHIGHLPTILLLHHHLNEDHQLQLSWYHH